MGFFNTLMNAGSMQDDELVKVLYTNYYNTMPSQCTALTQTGYRLMSVTFDAKMNKYLWVFQFDPIYKKSFDEYIANQDNTTES